MAVDATGTPTSPDSIPTYNTAADNPSGKGLNNIVAAIQTALSGRVTKPVGVLTNDVPVWNGTTWVKPTGSHTGTNFLRDDGSWAPAGGSAAAMIGNPAYTANVPNNGANLAILIPVYVPGSITITKLNWIVNNSSGNFDIGIYDSSFNKVQTKGSTAMAGTNAPISTTITAAVLTAGQYYFAFVVDNATGSYWSPSPFSGSGLVAFSSGALQKAASFPLPASLSGSVASTVPIPTIIGLP